MEKTSQDAETVVIANYIKQLLVFKQKFSVRYKIKNLIVIHRYCQIILITKIYNKEPSAISIAYLITL